MKLPQASIYSKRLFLILLYPAQEESIPAISSETIFGRMKLENIVLAERDETMELIKKDTNEIILTMGTGNIYRMVKGIIEYVQIV